MPPPSSDFDNDGADASASNDRSSDDRGRSSRLSVRLPGAQKALIDQAAELSGLTTTAFVVSALVEKARAVVVDARLATLSDADRDAFLAALYDGEPTDALARASQAHEGLVASTSSDAVAYDAPSTTEPETAGEEATPVEAPLLDLGTAGLASQTTGDA